MGYIQENQILLYKELCEIETPEDEVTFKQLLRFKENIKLANSIAMKFSNPWDASIDKDDIVQEAYIGLWKACQGFDESRGLAFSTYAVPMIKGQIWRMLRDTNAIKIPRSFKDIRSALISHGFTLPLSDEEIDVLISEGKFSRHQILQYAEVSVSSYDRPMDNEENGTNFVDMLPDEYFNIDESMRDEIFEEFINKSLEYIKPEHRDLVEEWLYSVLIDNNPVTQMELKRKYKISQPQVSRILRAATEIFRLHREELLSLLGL